MDRQWGFDTTVIHGHLEGRNIGAVVQPIVPAVAYSFESHEAAAETVAGKREGVYYGRYGNATLQSFEERVALLENGEAALGVSSGMAAISTVLLSLLQHGDHVIVTKDVYGGTYHFLKTLAPRFGITFSFVNCTDFDSIRDAIQDNTKAVYIETPSNPLLTVLDVEGIANITRQHQIPLVIDNTFMSPYLQKPLNLGADIVIHSATKYLNGHGDVIAGVIVADRERIRFMRQQIMGDLGQVLSAGDASLLLRGMKTLGLRMERHCTNAYAIAEFLESHPQVTKVYYPGLPSHPQYETARKQMKGMGGIVSFEVKGGLESATAFLDALRLSMISFSLGDPETLVQHPATMTHFSLPEAVRKASGITDGLIRLSAGLEDVEDIIQDLSRAFDQLQCKNFHEVGQVSS
ncbi:methionine gamma-lyase [Bacillus sp. OxB-1]|uniref:trans-sulfuration enzyme family protein n=1 Tax=Bacillus sp. (strain OxB-1) TaxID=98228 RepID=UPI000581CEF9|nr:aminotransferase class I/II-fold pyridoxal phosphate-dependent enzyme [Bacillus sp. OxB-1]BAQ09793.1 methionine gamma-lyase [Bacillus sp. OxB-1]